MTGVALEQARGIGWLNTAHPDDKQAVLNVWQTAIQTGGEFTMEYRVLTAVAEVRWLTGSTAAQRNKVGAVSGYVGIITDISERKHMEEKLRALSLTDELTGNVRTRLEAHLAAVNAQGFVPDTLAMSIGMVHRQADALGSLDDLLAADARMYEINRNKRKNS